MDKSLDPEQSIELANRIKSKAKSSFQNASKAIAVVEGALYVQGFIAYVALQTDRTWLVGIERSTS
jgi:hypothetical protein